MTQANKVKAQQNMKPWKTEKIGGEKKKLEEKAQGKELNNINLITRTAAAKQEQKKEEAKKEKTETTEEEKGRRKRGRRRRRKGRRRRRTVRPAIKRPLRRPTSAPSFHLCGRRSHRSCHITQSSISL